MKVADYFVECLIDNGTTDVFGLPGEIILEFLDALDRHSSEICAHICYHEQAGALAACGYAQTSGKLGVAYATKGPGITNMISAMQDAYRDSIPVVFMTAHESSVYNGEMRFKDSQEIDTVRLFSSMMKCVIRIDDIDTAVNDIEEAIKMAQIDRPGPVLIDFSNRILSRDIQIQKSKSRKTSIIKNKDDSNCHEIAAYIIKELWQAKCPVILFGDGIWQSGMQAYARSFVEKVELPALTSRFSQDVVGDSEFNFGYIGSHATRYSNTIIKECDLIVSLGNRLAFNPDSVTFGEIPKHTKVIRIDIDESEFSRHFPNTEQYKENLASLMPILFELVKPNDEHKSWLALCKSIRTILIQYDMEDPVRALTEIILKAESNTIITSDVGNNEFWLSRAYAFAKVSNRILFSKSFGLLGCSIPKAIGAHIASGSKIFCFTGDQGFQMNMQELQFIATNNLPILIIVINNNSSGMIRSKQEKRNAMHFLQTTNKGGYFSPPLSGIANAYNIGYYKAFCEDIDAIGETAARLSLPCILELVVPETLDISPSIPFGNSCDEFVPPTKDEDKRKIMAMNFNFDSKNEGGVHDA